MHFSAPSSISSLARRGRLVLLALVFLFAGVTICEAGAYGAVAISRSTGRFGSSYNYDTRAQAERRALSECGTRDARVLTWVANKYLALARGPGNSFGSGHASTERGAQREALHRCRGGAIVASFYSGR